VKLKQLAAGLLAVCLLTGCSSLLEREYSTAEPHSSKFWESEAADTLRAANYQDIVNDLLILIGQHKESAILRLYEFGDELSVADTLERAALEIQQETPLGAYAVSFITYAHQAQRGYYEATIQIGYRRTAEQIQAVVSATSPEAVASLLESALDNGRTELAVRMSYWGDDGTEKVEAAVVQVREERNLTETPMWQVHYYPESGRVGLVEFLLEPPPPQEVSAMAEEPAEASEESGVEATDKKI